MGFEVRVPPYSRVLCFDTAHVIGSCVLFSCCSSVASKKAEVVRPELSTFFPLRTEIIFPFHAVGTWKFEWEGWLADETAYVIYTVLPKKRGVHAAHKEWHRSFFRNVFRCL